MSCWDDVDETTLKPEWANRPRVGDIIAPDGIADMHGEVVATFYRNGEGGMHVRYEHGICWSSCHRAVIVRRCPR
jgi:hypothetical protein